MPIKWTPERDQTLLLKILETSDISANVKLISETWPENEEAPTPRAIQERLHKIRANAGSKGSGTFKMVGTVGSRGGAKASPAKSSVAKLSPAKGTATPKKNGKGGASNKRKRGANNDDESNATEVSFNSEENGSDVDGNKATTPSRTKKPTKKAAMTEARFDDNAAAANKIKEEPLEKHGMDGAFDASFTMPGEI
ncbi:MAG: hypothetical protein Q9166_004882 [cf. Caloplaca sp. 2 TL-2023]